jgi:hypothetical protein
MPQIFVPIVRWGSWVTGGRAADVRQTTYSGSPGGARRANARVTTLYEGTSRIQNAGFAGSRASRYLAPEPNRGRDSAHRVRVRHRSSDDELATDGWTTFRSGRLEEELMERTSMWSVGGAHVLTLAASALLGCLACDGRATGDDRPVGRPGRDSLDVGTGRDSSAQQRPRRPRLAPAP